MKIAIVVQGRFHAFDLVRGLIERGHDVTVFTNYPRWAVARFGLSPDCVRSFPFHGVLARVAGKVQDKSGVSFDAHTHPLFGRWALRQLRRESWDVVHAWSGICEEIYSDDCMNGSLKLVMRGSAHIRTQARILAEEQERCGSSIDQPSQWMIEREEREYALADRIVVLSTFAYDSFREHGIPDGRLRLLPLGADLMRFRPSSLVVQERIRRICSGAPLNVLYAGNISFQKGMLDLAAVIRALAGENFRFRLVGGAMPEVNAIVSDLGARAEFVSRVPQSMLPEVYAAADLFIFPTLQDGFAAVLAQSQASALPVLTTTNCAGPDLIRPGTGWVMPIRRPDLFIECLRWCDANRVELAEKVDCLYKMFQPRDYSAVAADFERICESEIRALHPAHV
jgi:glycosyltransferase involved in cell wall biosynthesis